MKAVRCGGGRWIAGTDHLRAHVLGFLVAQRFGTFCTCSTLMFVRMCAQAVHGDAVPQEVSAAIGRAAEAAAAFARWYRSVPFARRFGTEEEPSVSVDVDGVEVARRDD